MGVESLHSGPLRQPIHNEPDRVAGESFPLDGQKEAVLFSWKGMRAKVVEVADQRSPGAVPQRRDSFLSTLAHDLQPSLFQVNVIDLEFCQLTTAQASVQECGDDSQVPTAPGGIAANSRVD